MSKKKFALIFGGLYVTVNVVTAHKIGTFGRMKEMCDISKKTGQQPPIGEYLAYILYEDQPVTWVKVKSRR